MKKSINRKTIRRGFLTKVETENRTKSYTKNPSFDIKYDNIIPETIKGRESYRKLKGQDHIIPVKGYYELESDIVGYIKEQVLNGKSVKEFKTIECQIMDISDDIAYSTYDLDDTLKSGFFRIYDILFPKPILLDAVKKDLNKTYPSITNAEILDTLLDIFKGAVWIPDIDLNKLDHTNYKDVFRWLVGVNYNTSVELVDDAFNRHAFTSSLVDQFVNGITYTPNRKAALSKVELKPEIRLKVEVLKKFNYQLNILSPRLKIVAYRGKEIIDKIFDTLTDESIQGFELMPKDFQDLYQNAPNKKMRFRIVCDFVAGMTDRYCLEFYARLTSENPETIFKPF